MVQIIVTAIFAAVLFAMTLLPKTAQAETAVQDGSGVIEEVVVTSRRRNETQQDVPASVTAFGLEAIEELKPRTLRDFDGLAPNVYIGMNTAGPGASALYIRGVGYADIEKTQTPQVGVIVDGVQMGSSTGQLIDVFDVESIEVNRGPQGLFYGKNTIGGNIVVNRVRPQLDEFGYKVSAEAGNHSSRTYKARVNLPIGETMALKVGAIERERDGFYDNLTLGGTAGDIDFSSQTIALRFQPNDRLDAILTYDRIDDDTQTMPQDPRFNGDDPFENLADKREPTEYEVDQWSLRVDWDINDRVSLHSVTASNEANDKVNQDFDGGAIDGAAIPFAQLHTLRDQEFEVFTQELRFDFNISERVDLQVGAYYYDSELDFRQDTNNVLQLPPVALGLPAGTPCSVLTPILGLRPNPGLGDVLCQFPNARSTQLAGEDVESMSFFAALTFRPIESVEVTVGARRIEEEKDVYNSYFDYSDGTFDTGPVTQEHNFAGLPERAGTAYTASEDWEDTISSVSVKWEITDNINTYFNYSEGFRSGGFSIRSARSPDEADFAPENAEQREFGVKAELLDGRLRVNLAYYELEVENSQFSSIITLPPGSIPGTTTLINNGAGAEYHGIELETRWRISDAWTLAVNYGTVDVDNKRFSIACELLDGCATGVPGVTDPLGTLRQRGGNDDSRQPDWNTNVSLSYGAALGNGFLAANVGWKKVGDFLLVNTGGGANQRLFEGGYQSIDARIAYEMTVRDNDTLTFSLFGKNLGDEEWKEQALFLGGPNTGFQGWGAPRTWAFEIVYQH